MNSSHTATGGAYNINDDDLAVGGNEVQINNGGQIDNGPKTTYICGNCGKDVYLDKLTGIVCQHCGHRIFYKKRDRKLLQYDAR